MGHVFSPLYVEHELVVFTPLQALRAVKHGHFGLEFRRVVLPGGLLLDLGGGKVWRGGALVLLVQRDIYCTRRDRTRRYRTRDSTATDRTTTTLELP